MNAERLPLPLAPASSSARAYDSLLLSRRQKIDFSEQEVICIAESFT